MNVKDFTYTELNNMFSELIDAHSDDTEFLSAESAEEFANDELISCDYLCVQNAFDDLAAKVDGLKDVFDWSCGIEANDYDVGLIHKYDCGDDYDNPVRYYMIHAECLRRNVDIDSVNEFVRIVKEMDCVSI